MVGVRLNPWILVTMAIFLLTGTCVSQEPEPGFPDGACSIRSWEDKTNADPNCDLISGPFQYYSKDDEILKPCLADHVSIYGSALWFPVGSASCEPRAYCVQGEGMCHTCEPVPLSSLVGDFDRCRCRPGFSVERISVDGDLFFSCQRDCEEDNGGCMQRCAAGEGMEEYECKCAEGYEEEEDGEICKDKDECLTGDNECRLPNTCKNRDGGYSCICSPGFVSSPDGSSCKRANELVCMISILEIPAPFEMDSEEKEFGELNEEEEDGPEYDESRIELMFREVIAGAGAWGRDVKVEPTFVNGHLEFQVIMQFTPEMEVEEETRILAALSERLSRSGYSTEMDGDSFYISRPVYCFSKTTGGIPLPIDAPCEWYKMAGFCLQNSQCGHDGGRPYCMCPDGWFGKRCEFGQITIVDIVLIVLVVLLHIMLLFLCCYVCMKGRRRRCDCGRSSCNGRSCSNTKVYAKTTQIAQPFVAPMKYQSSGITGAYNIYQ